MLLITDLTQQTEYTHYVHYKTFLALSDQEVVQLLQPFTHISIGLNTISFERCACLVQVWVNCPAGTHIDMRGFDLLTVPSNRQYCDIGGWLINHLFPSSLTCDLKQQMKHFREIKETGTLSLVDVIDARETNRSPYEEYMVVRNLFEEHLGASVFYAHLKEPIQFGRWDNFVPYQDRFLTTCPEAAKGWPFQSLFKDPSRGSRYTGEVSVLPREMRLTAYSW